MLDPNLSRARQKRLLDEMAARKLDAVVVGAHEHVQYLSARRPNWLTYGAFILWADGKTWMTSGETLEGAAVDDAVTYEARWLATLRQEQPMVVAAQVVEALRARRTREIGVDASSVSSQVALMAVDVEPIDAVLWQLRRRKDADELALMRKAAQCVDAMYAKAREIVRPGVLELEVFVELQAAATREAGEPLSAYLGNDYACGAGGGPPRPGRAAKAGEIYVIDVGPAYRGYFSDTCRAFAVDQKPTDTQMQAWNAIVDALKIVERTAKPGARCRDIYQEVFDHLATSPVGKFPHHLGHGVGLQPHEYPHLNPKWDDVLMEGEVFTAEPGLYSPAINGGIRLENIYHVTAGGVENLIAAPLELV
ncbi:MAG: Xaa-Pro dipeptidase [Phycisphaerales bacterium]|jgi:Xaa-Pro aminopeptidase|nr:Xaa-Pro dipeptidase [Phycisphaerales bacterium]